MESESSPPCPYTVTVRRNPHRKARATPSTNALPRPPPNPIASEIPSFPTEEILAMQLPQTLSTPTDSTENLRVFLRIRPLTIQGSGKCGSRGNQSSKSAAKNAWPQNPSAKIKKKKSKNSEICIAVNNTQSVTLLPPSHLKDLKRIKSEVYEGFSYVFSADSSQEEVYERMVNPLVEDFISGKSGMLAALGPSGSGKTHTVFGCPREPGMVPLALKQIFKRTEGSVSEATRSFYLSMFEIYSERGKGERLLDLSPGGTDLFMQQSSIKGLQEVIISGVAHAESLIAQAMLKRSTAMTNSNSQSSRSQCIINIRRGIDIHLNSAVLTIVDLAGAEREKRTGNQRARLLESNFINNTSMVFGLCLRSLLEHQRNPKKPLQKHFQNSLLTRYLRDYLEGKKRMALILTIKPGEEDYLDTSFLLKQASPYMKIKFNNVEELSDLVSNKRHAKTLPQFEQRKRMKFSEADSCAGEEITLMGMLQKRAVWEHIIIFPFIGSVKHRFKTQVIKPLDLKGQDDINVDFFLEIEGDSVGDEQLCGSNEEVNPEQLKETGSVQALVQSPRNAKLDANDSTFLKLKGVDLAKRERNNQIMQGFAKALWNVLKQYKEKLEVAENQIRCLRENLDSEKEKYFELDKEMKDLKSHCFCCKEKVVEVTLPDENPNSKLTVDDSSQLEGHGSTNVDEEAVNQVHSLRESLKRETVTVKYFELDKEMKDWKSHCFGCKEKVVETTLPEENPNSKLTVDDSSQLEGHGSTSVNEEEENPVQSLRESLKSEKAKYFELDKEMKDLKSHCSSCKDKVVETIPDENPNSKLTVDDSSQLEGHGSTNVDEAFEHGSTPRNCDSCGQQELDTVLQILLDPPQMPKEVAVIPECNAGNFPESEEVNCCRNHLLVPQQMSKEGDAIRELCHIGDVVESEAEVHSCSKVTQVCDADNATESEAEGNSCSKLFLAPPIMPKEDAAVGQECNTCNVPKSEAELGSCRKGFKAEKPRRRLLPASSMLLRDMGALDLEDENQKPRGTRGGKKLAADDINRTQGSISLLRLLKSNLRL